MSKTTITRSFSFDAAHRILNHESKCKHVHGHRYVFELTVNAPSLDALGRVIDFGVVKQLVGKWIDDNLDHNIILHKDDLLAVAYRRAYDPEGTDRKAWEMVLKVFDDKAPYVMGENPTAENMARHLFTVCQGLLPDHITVMHVRLYETPNCWADYKEGEQ
jgi:6-pyruvoyltetrahydropterin/6-carboxytetrahydropterin synthase